MGFGSGNTLRLRRPSFRRNLIDDMEKVVAGQSANNPALLNIATNLQGVSYITRNGSFIAVIGESTIGDGDVVGVQQKMNIEEV